MTLVSPRRAGGEVHNFNGEFGSVFAGASLGQRKQETGVRTRARTNGLTGKGSAPKRCARRKSDFHKAALIVADGIAGFDESFSVPGEKYAVTGFLNVGEQNGLLRVAGDINVERTRSICVTGADAKSEECRRLAAGDRFAEIAGIGALKTLSLYGFVLDFAGTENIDGNATSFAFRTGEMK